MSGGVDSAGQPGGDHNAALTERGGEVAAETPAISRSVARPDYRDYRAAEQLCPPEHRQDRRRVLDRREPARVDQLAPADELRAETMQCGDLGLGLGPGYRCHGLRPFAAAGELRHHLERGVRRAEAAQQGIEADRADRLGAA